MRKLKKSLSYFLNSCAYESARAFFSIFTIPTNTRKFLEKDKSHRENYNNLVKKIEFTENIRDSKNLKKAVDLGDKTGFLLGGFLAPVIYGVLAVNGVMDYVNNPENLLGKTALFDILAFTNGFSFGKEFWRYLKRK